MADSELTRALARKYNSLLGGSVTGYESFSEALANVRFRRDKETAHNEAVAEAERIQASWGDLEIVLKVAQDFCAVVGPAYFDFHFAANDGTYMLSRQHQEMGRSMSGMLKDLDIQ